MIKKKCELQYLCLVDETGRFLGEEEKETCHLGEGLLHSAFLVMIFNDKNELMLGRRSAQKTLWPGYWDGSVASHYYKDREEHETVAKRLHDEIGTSSENLEYLFKFRYQANYEGIGSENEICDVFRVKDIDPKDLSINCDEISEFRYVSLAQARKDIRYNVRNYTPWFVIALEKFLINRR
ncbi:isopentenyl-diphosphate delta-isomerase [Acidobacteriota bacterium]